MKKIVIACCAFACAIVANAAAVSWSVKSANDWKNGTVYAITGYSSEEVIALFQSTSESDWASAVSGVTGASISSRGAAASATEGVGESIVFAFVSSSGIADGNTWAVSADISTDGYTYEGNETQPGTLTYTYGGATTGTFTAAAIPEPTSGLLLLLGMAGLALRRKQK